MLAQTNVSEFDDFVASVAPYMARVLAIAKYSNIDLQMSSTNTGEELKKMLNEVSLQQNLLSHLATVKHYVYPSVIECFSSVLLTNAVRLPLNKTRLTTR